jgi:hypothetical protein
MQSPTKFVQPLREAEREQRKEGMQSQAPQRTRMRAHASLLSERRYAIDQIADLYQVDRDRVSEWWEWWEEDQLAGWEEDPRGGRPPQLTEKEQNRAGKLPLKEPRALRQGLTALASTAGKILSRDTLKRRWGAEDYGWKRLRRRLRSLREEGEFRAAQAELAALRARAPEPARQSALWDFAEAGFTLTPWVPYAWQRGGQTRELASIAHARISGAFATCGTNFLRLPLRAPVIPSP